MEREDRLSNLVLDSSVVIKWFSNEADTDKALSIREKFLRGENLIAVPDIQLYEILNALRYNTTIQRKEVIDAVESLIDIGLNIIVPTKDVMKSSIEIAFEFDISVYDAYFVALAKELISIFITADEKLYEKIKSLKFVRLLKNVKIE